MATQLIKVIADTLIKGVPVPASDEIIEVDAADAVILISACKAEKYCPPDEGEDEQFLPATTLEDLIELPEQETLTLSDPQPDQEPSQTLAEEPKQ